MPPASMRALWEIGLHGAPDVDLDLQQASDDRVGICVSVDDVDDQTLGTSAAATR